MFDLNGFSRTLYHDKTLNKSEKQKIRKFKTSFQTLSSPACFSPTQLKKSDSIYQLFTIIVSGCIILPLSGAHSQHVKLL